MNHPEACQPRIRVKFLSRVDLPDRNVGADYLRRFPARIPSWGRCDFIFDATCRDYDWLVVYDDLPRRNPLENLACPRANTLILTGEPSSISHYGERFLQQFGHVLTSQEPTAIDHPGTIRRQTGLLWYYGGSDARGTFDALIAAPPPQKTQLISSVCSNKAMKHTLHAQRLAFTKRLMQNLPELDVYGYGMRDLANKADAIDPYRYHLVIENHSCDHHWTEKLADAFLGYSMPIYFGCTNLDIYFPPDSYLQIDIRDYAASLARIRSIMVSDKYEKRLPALIEARRRVLENYSTFAQLAALIPTLPQANGASAQQQIRGRRSYRYANPISAVRDLLSAKHHPPILLR
jgi:Glycosyltransferase family 10 (fucosyltransferase) C-term